MISNRWSNKCASHHCYIFQIYSIISNFWLRMTLTVTHMFKVHATITLCLLTSVCWDHVKKNKVPVSNQHLLSLSYSWGNSHWQMQYDEPLRVRPWGREPDCACEAAHSPPALWGFPGGQGCPWSDPISWHDEPCQWPAAVRLAWPRGRSTPWWTPCCRGRTCEQAARGGKKQGAKVSFSKRILHINVSQMLISMTGKRAGGKRNYTITQKNPSSTTGARASEEK